MLLELPGEKSPLHAVHSFRLDQRVRRCARILDDSLLHAKLQCGDMIAQDAMYHRGCLSNLYRNASSVQLEGHYTDQERRLHGIAFSELISFIEETVTSSQDRIPIFKLSDLRKLYCRHLEHLGILLETRVHSTRLKNRTLSQFEDMSAHKEGKEVILMFNRDIGEAVSSAASINYDDEGFILAKAACILRR